MNDCPTKVCEVCRTTFTPDPCVGKRQRVCEKLRCQRERRQRSQRNWLAQNPDAFRGRYPKLKLWLDAHPGYLKNYRTHQRQALGSPDSDIQDELTASQNSTLNTVRQLLDIQDELTSKIIVCKHHLQQLGAVICKTSETPST